MYTLSQKPPVGLPVLWIHCNRSLLGLILSYLTLDQSCETSAPALIGTVLEV